MRIRGTVLAFFGVILMTSSLTHAQTETVLLNFATSNNPTGASVPTSAPLFNASGNLYGATEAGSVNEVGTIYELTLTEAGPWKPKVVFSFGGTSGIVPYGALTFDSAGNLYGVTSRGGSGGPLLLPLLRTHVQAHADRQRMGGAEAA